MATTSLYRIKRTTALREALLDFNLNYPEYDNVNFSLAGQNLTFRNNFQSTDLFVRPGVSITLESSTNASVADKIYLQGSWTDYRNLISLANGTLTLSRGSGNTLEQVEFLSASSSKDVLVFKDGFVTVKKVFDALSPNPVVALNNITADNATTSATLPTIPASPSIVDIKAVLVDSNGENVVSFGPGTKLTVSGSSGIDRVYVKEGSEVYAVNMRGGIDEIYVRGNSSDYTPDLTTLGVLKLTRSVIIGANTYTESVSVGSSLMNNDLLVFADGAIRTNDAAVAFKANANTTLSTLAGKWDATKATPGLTAQIDLTNNASGNDYSKALNGAETSAGASIAPAADVLVSFSAVQSIKVAIGGTGFDAAHDKLLLTGRASGEADIVLPLNTSRTPGTDATIGSISHLSYSYNATSHVLTITPTSGSTLATADVENIVQAIKFQNTEDAPNAGDRTFAISVTNGSGTGAVSTATLTVPATLVATPTLALVPDSTPGVTAQEAAAGAVTVNAVTGSTVAVTFTDGHSHSVIKSINGTGTAVNVTLTVAEITSNGLLDESITVTAVASKTGYADRAAAPVSFALDTHAPTLTIASDKSALKSGETATITFAFSETPVGFDSSDISVIGGTLGALSNVGSVRTALFTPSDGMNAGNASISVAAGSYTDTAGNAGGGGSKPALPFDTKAPVLLSTWAKGRTVTLRFDADLDASAFSASTPVATINTLFSLQTAASAGGTFSPVNNAFSAISVSGSTVTLTLATALTSSQFAKLSYTPPNSEQTTAVVQDRAGNDLASLAGTSIILTPLITDFAVSDSVTSNGTALGKGGEIVTVAVTFSEAVSLTASTTYTVHVKVGTSGAGFNATFSTDANVQTATATYRFAGTLPGTAGLSTSDLQLDLLTVPATASITNTTGQTLAQTSYQVFSNAYTVDTDAPAKPTGTLDDRVTGGATAAEATAPGGVLRLNAEPGSTVAVTFTDSHHHSVIKTITGTGSALAVTLDTADLGSDTAGKLQDGGVTVSAVATDAAGNDSAAYTTTFTLDTSVPDAPSLSLASGISGGATVAEATANNGVLSLTAESGISVVLTFSDSSHSLPKTVIGMGPASAVVVTLDATDIGTGANALNEGTINVSALATDAAGNQSPLASKTFYLDKTPPRITSSSSFNVTENLRSVGTAQANEPVSWALDGNANDNALFAINPSTGEITWLAVGGRDFEGASKSATGTDTYKLTVSARDAAGYSTTQLITVTLTNVNETPVNTLPASAPTIYEDIATAITGISVHDEDASPNGISSVQLSVVRGRLNVVAGVPNGLAVAAISTNGTKSITLTGSETAINATLASLSYTGNPNYNGSDRLTVLSTDGGGMTTSSNLDITVSPVNDAPTVKATAPSSRTFVKNRSTVTLNLTDVFTDVDAGDTLTYSISSGLLPLGLALANGIISGTPTSNVTGSNITFTATDRGGESVNQIITFNVGNQPVIESISVFDSDTGNANKFGKQDAIVTLKVTLSEVLSTIGTLDAANISASFSAAGSPLTNVSYQSMATDSNKTVLTFTGTLPAGNDTNVVLTRLAINPGLTLRNSSGIALEATQTGLTISDSYTLDNTPPTATTLTLSVRDASNALKAGTAIKSGDRVELKIDLNESFSVLSGLPAANATNTSVFLLGGSPRNATWSTSGNSLLLTWTAGVTAGNLTVDTVQLRSAINQFGITDQAGNPLALSDAITTTASLTIDNTPPTLAAATALRLSMVDSSGTAITTDKVNAGDKIKLDINFGEPVAGLKNLPNTGASVNTLFTVGGLPVGALWSKTGNVLSLTYTVAASDNGAVLTNVPALRTLLSNAQITDLAGNALSIPDDLEASNEGLKVTETTWKRSQVVDNLAPVAPGLTINPQLRSTTHNWSTHIVYSNAFGITPTKVFTLATEYGSTLTATFADSAGLPLVKTVKANSYAVDINFTSADFGNGDNQIGNGLIKASFVTTDPAGNVSAPTLLSFYSNSFSAPEAVQMSSTALSWPVGASNVSIAPTVKAPVETNIKTLVIQVAPASGAAALDSHDQLFLEDGTGHSLGADFSGTEVTLGGVMHLNYSYVASTHTLSISPDMHGDIETFYNSPADISAVLAAIRYGRDVSPAAGTFGRSFTIDYIDNSSPTPLHASSTATSTGTWTATNAALTLNTVLGTDTSKDLDVMSNLVLTSSVAINPVAGGVLTVTDNGPSSGVGKTGYGAENTTNTYRITLGSTLAQSTWSRFDGEHWTAPVVDSQLVTLDASGTHISVNLPNDLDFSSSYTLGVEPGSFTAQSGGGLNGTALSANFKTVTPAPDKNITSTQGQSWMLDGSGQWASSYIWKDMTGWGNPDNSVTLLDLSNQPNTKLAFVAADKEPAQPLNTEDGKTGIGLANMNLALYGFNENKLIYIDDQGRNEVHGPSALANVYKGSIPVFYPGSDVTTLALSTPSSPAAVVNATYMKFTLDADASQTEANLYVAVGTSNPFDKNVFYPDFTAWSRSVGAPEHTSLWVLG